MGGCRKGSAYIVSASFPPTRLEWLQNDVLNIGHYVVFEKEDKRGDKYPATVREKLIS